MKPLLLQAWFLRDSANDRKTNLHPGNYSGGKRAIVKIPQNKKKFEPPVIEKQPEPVVTPPPVEKQLEPVVTPPPAIEKQPEPVVTPPPATEQQPEPVVFYPEMIQVREAWNFDLDWIIRFE